MTRDLRTLYEAWKAAKDACNTGLDMDGPEYEAEFSRLLELEAEIIAAPAATARDMALKIIVADDEGDMCMSSAQRALVRSAYDMAGLPIYASWSPAIA